MAKRPLPPMYRALDELLGLSDVQRLQEIDKDIELVPWSTLSAKELTTGPVTTRGFNGTTQGGWVVAVAVFSVDGMQRYAGAAMKNGTTIALPPEMAQRAFEIAEKQHSATT